MHMYACIYTCPHMYVTTQYISDIAEYMSRANASEHESQLKRYVDIMFRDITQSYVARETELTGANMLDWLHYMV